MNEAEEAANNANALAGGEGYPWSRREEMKALAVTKGWCVLPLSSPPRIIADIPTGALYLLEDERRRIPTSTTRNSSSRRLLEI